jgi:hypothetical protein
MIDTSTKNKRRSNKTCLENMHNSLLLLLFYDLILIDDRYRCYKENESEILYSIWFIQIYHICMCEEEKR